MIIVGLIKFLIGFIGLAITFVFLVIAAIRRSSQKLKKAGIAFFSTTAVIIIISLVELMFYPVNPKNDKLVFTAFREAPIGAYWLGLYSDSTWEMGNSSREIEISGIYRINGDTVELKATSEKGFYNGDTLNFFLIQGKDLIEIENTGIKGLKITMNKIN
ncbi:hypothetical protein PZB74_01865 [Porifericola rhodea]|uniref:hypothetical protein n=1 Tax=Porifericola rhodea TaxID=930972 RepID=UPI002665F095|nr:hypothetical protein [Porifericola rhodea]WKN32098.1 hypothetical protein PZB74_01865 [Porifericola rhodea]